MSVNECVTRGGLPDGWTFDNLAWLAKAHRHLAADKNETALHGGTTRIHWHRRWAALCEDLLETRIAYRNRI